MLKIKSLLVAAIFLAALLGFVFWDMVATEKRKSSTESSQEKLLPETYSEVEWVEIHALDKPLFRFECAEESQACSLATNIRWRVTKPRAMDADSVHVGSFLATLGSVSPSEIFSQDLVKDWKSQFSLDKPAVIARIKSKASAEPVELSFGGKAVVGNDHYALSTLFPGKALAVPSYLVKAIDRDEFHWRNKSLFPGLTAESVEAMTWQHSQLGTKMSVERKGEEWFFLAPGKGRADSLALNGLVSGLVNWAAIGEVAEAGKGQKFLEVKFTTTDKKQHSLIINPTADKTKFIAKSSSRGWFAHVEAGEVNRFLRTYAELRDPRLITSEELNLAKKLTVKLKDSDVAIVWDKDPNGVWTRLSGVEGEEDFVGLFSAAEVKSHENALPSKLGARATAELFDADNKLLRTFAFYRQSPEIYFTTGEFNREFRRLSPRFSKSIEALASPSKSN